MTTTTLLEYLTLPNPELDCSKSSTGANTSNARWDPITGLEDWAEFNYETLMQSYGQILRRQIPPLPHTSPPLTKKDREIFTEKIFEDVLERAIMPNVSAALCAAWPLCYSNNDPGDITEVKRGDHAKRGIVEEDVRFSADWAGVRDCQTTNFGYKNLCPGETKLASKWSTSKEGRRRTDFTTPFSQIQTYCGRQWNVCHGYIITTEELVVIRVSKELVGPGLAGSKAIRNVSQHASHQQSHSRTFSAETISSGFQAMSLDTGSSYNDDANLNIEYKPLQFKSIPWNVAGEDTLTVKLGLFSLLLMTKGDVSVQSTYPPLTSLSRERQAQSLIGEANTVPSPEPVQNADRTTGKGKGPGKKRL